MNTLFEYIVGFHIEDMDYFESEISLPTQVSIGHIILWPENDTEYVVFKIVHMIEATHIYVKEL